MTSYLQVNLCFLVTPGLSCLKTIIWTNLLACKGQLPEDIFGLFLAREANDSKGVVATASQTEGPGHMLSLLTPGQLFSILRSNKDRKQLRPLLPIPGDSLPVMIQVSRLEL